MPKSFDLYENFRTRAPYWSTLPLIALPPLARGK